MVAIRMAADCDCESCEGGHHTPGRYGGWTCTCPCHGLRGDDRKEFIKLKKDGSPFDRFVFFEGLYKRNAAKPKKRKIRYI